MQHVDGPQGDKDFGAPADPNIDSPWRLLLSGGRPDASGEPWWGIPDAVIGWLIAMVASGLGFAIVLALAGKPTDTPADDLSITLIALSYPPLWLGFIGVPWAVARAKGQGLIKDFRLKISTIDLVGVPVGLLAQVAMVPLVSWPFLKLSGRSWDDLGAEAQKLADKAQGSSLGVVLLVLIVVIGAPIAEEIFFRGLVLRAIEKRFGLVAAIAGSSVAFGLTHFQALQFPALTVVGLIFALLAVRFERLGPAILAHMAFNAVTVANLVWFT